MREGTSRELRRSLPFTLFHAGARIAATLTWMDATSLRVWTQTPIDAGTDCGGSLSLGGGLTVGLDLHVTQRTEGGHDGVRGHVLAASYMLQRATDEIPLFDMLRFLGATIDPLARRARPESRLGRSGASLRHSEASRSRHSRDGDESQEGLLVEHSRSAASAGEARSSGGASQSGLDHSYSMPGEDIVGRSFDAAEDLDFQADLITESPKAGHTIHSLKSAQASGPPSPPPHSSLSPTLPPSRSHGFTPQAPGPGRLDVPPLDALNSSLPPPPAAPATSFAADTWELPAISDGPLSRSGAALNAAARAPATDFERVGLHLSRSLGRSLGQSQDSGPGLAAAPAASPGAPPAYTSSRLDVPRLDVPRLDVPRLDVPRLDTPRMARRSSDPGHRTERAARTAAARPKPGFAQAHQEISLRRLLGSNPSAAAGPRSDQGSLGPHSTHNREHPSEASRGPSMHDSVADDHLNSSMPDVGDPSKLRRKAQVPAAAPKLKRDALPTPLVAAGNPAFVKLSYVERDLARAAIRPNGQQLLCIARAVDGLLVDQTLLLLLELPNNQYLQIDARVHAVKPDLIVETATKDLGLVRAVLAATLPLG